MNQTTATPIETLSFEDAVKELEAIVRKLESGGTDLDSSIALYTRGTSLRTHCEKKLQEAKLKVEKIVASASGGIATEPFEAE